MARPLRYEAAGVVHRSPGVVADEQAFVGERGDGGLDGVAAGSGGGDNGGDGDAGLTVEKLD